MSSDRKRKLPTDLKASCDEIHAILAKIKPSLGARDPTAPSRADLLRLADLGEAIARQRPRSRKEWAHMADVLDGEGVALWNTSVVGNEPTEREHRTMFALLRLAGFRLIEAGMEQKPGIESLTHVLKLASKAGSSLSDVGDNDIAASVLSSAAKYEELLRNAEDPQNAHSQSRARAIVVYYSSRMEAAWREGNEGVAEFMLEKLTEGNQYLPLLSPPDRSTIACKLLEIGKALLRKGARDNEAAKTSLDAVKWIQKAFSISETLDVSADAGDQHLRRSILRSLARAYFLSSAHEPDNLTRAEASLQELIASVDASDDHSSAEFQQLRWMRVAILKRRKGAHASLLEAFRSILDHMEFSESTVTDVLQELRSFGHDHVLVTAVLQHCLQQAADPGRDAGRPFIDRVLLSLLFHCSKDAGHTRAMQDVNHALECLALRDYELPKISATACLTLLWQFGDRQHNAKRWAEAAEWFLIGTHHVFGAMAHVASPKCFRKAAMCYIQLGDHAQACAMVRRCPEEEAATHYVALLIAIQQGLETEAVDAVRAMVLARNFDKKMLLLATRLAHDSGMKRLLLTVLEALLDTLQSRQGIGADVEAVTLVRCIIRLALKMLSEPGSDRTTLIRVLIKHFNTTLSLLRTLNLKEDAAVALKDVSWLWRTAYNTAIQGCTEWEESEERVSDLFDIARQLLQVHLQTAVSDVDTEVHVYIVNASFASVAGRVFAARHKDVPGSQDAESKRQVTQEIVSGKDHILHAISKPGALGEEDTLRAHSFLNVLRIFEAEIACAMNDWTRIPRIIEEIASSPSLSMETFEAIADILWVEKGCPVAVLFAALEAILHASLDRDVLSVEKFARWLRAICTILLARNAAADRTRAIGYVEQAAGVLEEHAEEDDPQAYPLDERQWLLGTAYNTGIECLHASLLDEAKRWFEAATTICRFVPDGGARSEKISRMYTQLLARYPR